MGNFVKKQGERPRMKLVRGVDGRLRPSDGSDIGDLWAEQKRIRLAEAIQEDQKKAEKQKRPKWRPFAHMGTKTAQPKTQSDLVPKEIVFSLSIPKLKLREWIAAARKKISKKQALGGGIALAVLTLIVGGYLLLPSGAKKDNGIKTEVLNTNSERPAYSTLLPKGKSIDDLGGWTRVSPPESEAVFAYVDAIDGVRINVSQQPLPLSFRHDTAEEIEELAKSFTANEKLTAGDIVAYLGTSIRGPQSVVFAKDDLLILIKSDSKLTSEQWVEYMSSLE